MHHGRKSGHWHSSVHEKRSEPHLFCKEHISPSMKRMARILLYLVQTIHCMEGTILYRLQNKVRVNHGLRTEIFESHWPQLVSMAHLPVRLNRTLQWDFSEEACSFAALDWHLDNQCAHCIQSPAVSRTKFLLELGSIGDLDRCQGSTCKLQK